MKIALVGYGKMGHMIESCAKSLGHEVVATIDVMAEDASVIVKSGDVKAVADAVKNSGADGVIEFSHPSAVMGNLKALIPLRIPVVVGTTGWGDKEEEIEDLCKSTGGTVMRSSNFSIGVNMFYKIVEEAAKIMAEYSEYDVAIWEAHHNQKVDSPSGTALEVARRVMSGNKTKTEMNREGDLKIFERRNFSPPKFMIDLNLSSCMLALLELVLCQELILYFLIVLLMKLK